jgi:TRAP-type transport system small permease protein
MGAVATPPSETERIVWQIASAARLAALAGLFGLLLVVAITIADIAMRSLFSAPIEGVFDVSQLLMLFTIGSCFPATLAGQHNLTIKLFGTFLPARLHQWFDTLGALLLLAVWSVVTWEMAQFTIDQWRSGVTTQHLHWPVAPWWSFCTAMIAVGVPIQLAVLAMHIERAVRGRGPAAPRLDAA